MSIFKLILISFLIIFSSIFFITGAKAASSPYVPLAPINGYTTDIDFSNPNSLSNYLNNLYKLLVGVAGVLAVIMIMWGGIEYMSTDAIGGKEEAKSRINNALLGLMIALGSFLILQTINSQFLNTTLKIGAVTAPELKSTPLGSRSPEDRNFMDGGNLGEPDPNFNTEGLFGNGNPTKVRSTYYYAGEPGSDPDTDAGRSASGIPLQEATDDQVGVAAVDPSKIPYGSAILATLPNGSTKVYIAGDTGGAVKSMQASGGRFPVIDFYGNNPIGSDYTNVQVFPYNNNQAFTSLNKSQKAAVINNIKTVYLGR